MKVELYNDNYAFQSTLPAWGATPERAGDGKAHRISIHAPRVGSDRTHLGARARTHISIHAPRVGSDKADS